jgi:hypothetical protein
MCTGIHKSEFFYSYLCSSPKNNNVLVLIIGSVLVLARSPASRFRQPEQREGLRGGLNSLTIALTGGLAIRNTI